jgi:hypothetical protein
MVERDAEPCAIEPAFEVGLRRRRLMMEPPEGFGAELLGEAVVASDAIKKPRETAVEFPEQNIEVAGGFRNAHCSR